MSSLFIRPLAVAGIVFGVVGYVVGMFVPYPGRELSLTVGMVSIAAAAVGGIGGGAS